METGPRLPRHLSTLPCLFPHAAGYWAKKIKGRLRYFGKVATDPDGKAALNQGRMGEGLGLSVILSAANNLYAHGDCPLLRFRIAVPSPFGRGLG